MEKVYTIGEAARELGVPASTLRFYDKRGLFPDLTRSRSGIRVYTEGDLEWARFIEWLKTSGMPLSEIKTYIDLYRAGDATIEERRRIVHARREAVKAQMAELELARDFIDYKCWYYDVAAESGTCDTPRTMAEGDLPPEIARIKRRCRINRY